MSSPQRCVEPLRDATPTRSICSRRSRHCCGRSTTRSATSRRGPSTCASQCSKNGVVYIAPGGAYVSAAYLPEDAEDVDDRGASGGPRLLVDAKDSTVSVVWESEGYSHPAAEILAQFDRTLTSVP